MIRVFFTLDISDVAGSVASTTDAGHGGMVMADVDPGTFTVSETGGTSTSLGDYTSTIECRDTPGHCGRWRYDDRADVSECGCRLE